jgi:carbamoyl-phosphate synthase large subunit
LAQQGATREIVPGYYSVKEAIFPFAKFQGVDPILGPEMRSTGEVMGVGRNFGEAFAKAQKRREHQGAAARQGFRVRCAMPTSRACCRWRENCCARLSLVATAGTCDFLRGRGLPCERINKVLEGRPHVGRCLIKNGEIVFIVNTTEGKQAIADSFSIRRDALQHRVTYSTTVSGARARLVHSNLPYRGNSERCFVDCRNCTGTAVHEKNTCEPIDAERRRSACAKSWSA